MRPADVYFRRTEEIAENRKMVKNNTFGFRKFVN